MKDKLGDYVLNKYVCKWEHAHLEVSLKSENIAYKS